MRHRDDKEGCRFGRKKCAHTFSIQAVFSDEDAPLFGGECHYYCKFRDYIAEGSGANTNKDFSNFLDISIKSVLETVNILYFALLRKYISETKQKELYKEAETLIRKKRAFKKTLR